MGKAKHVRVVALAAAVLGSVLFVVAVAVAGAAASTARPPILFDSALRCPSGNCRGVKYDARIYEIAKIGFPARALTSAASNDTNPVWSPDHTKIAFYRSGSSASAAATLWVMNADGAGQHQLSSTPVGVGGFDYPSWSSAGYGGPAWSPDGKEIAFVGKPSGSNQPGDLYTIKADGTGIVDLTAGDKSLSVAGSSLIARYPNWSSNSTEIAFETVYGEFPSTVEIPSAGGATKLLFTRANMQAWSPDGTLFAYVVSGAKGLDHILTSTPSGGNTTTLTQSGDNFEPAWSPDGTMLVYVRSNQITVMNADGTGVKQLTRHNPAVFVENPSW